MVDHVINVGRSGQMMIRDHGGDVEFLVRVGYSGTWWGSVGYSWSGPGTSGSGAFGYPGGGGWLSVRRVWVGSNGNVSWTINNTGTSEFGGPHTQTAWVQRATVPGAPVSLGLDQITHTSIRYRFSGTTDGGAPIREWQIGYGTDPNTPQHFTGSNGTTVVGNLTPGLRYYFWSRGRNDVGWSGWSNRIDNVTHPPVRVRVNGTWRLAIPYVKVGGVWKPAIGYVKVADTWRATRN